MPYYKRIHDLREDHDYTQQQVADYLGMKQPQYYRYESGIRDIPTDILIALSKLYDTSIDYMLELTDNPNIKP
ncbi:MAG: helix-turn-helix transcriptional regulator [Ruminococcus sp.]|nr:helix-turn-helix transcriptional regulator [Ruminococcus sp.]